MTKSEIPDVNIRPAQIDDCRKIGIIQVDSYKKAYAGIFPPTYLDHFTYDEQEQDWQEWFSAESNDVLLVAETQFDEVVGYALGRSGPSEIDPFDSELVALHVAKGYQGKGVGRRLVSVVAKALISLGCRSMMLWTAEVNQTRAWYENLGGALIGKKAWGGNSYYGVKVNEVAYGWEDIEILVC